MTAGAARPRSRRTSVRHPGDPLTRGREETRLRILSAALSLFAHRPYRRTTVRSIGREAGLTDPAIYYYFRSKREIVDALLALPLDGTLTRFTSGVRLSAESLRALLDHMIELTINQDALLRLTMRLGLEQDHEARRVHRAHMDALKEQVTVLFATATSDEEAAASADLFTTLLFGAVYAEQVRCGPEYPLYAATPEFHHYIYELICGAIPACRCQFTPVP